MVLERWGLGFVALECCSLLICFSQHDVVACVSCLPYVYFYVGVLFMWAGWCWHWHYCHAGSGAGADAGAGANAGAGAGAGAGADAGAVLQSGVFFTQKK